MLCPNRLSSGKNPRVQPLPPSQSSAAGMMTLSVLKTQPILNVMWYDANTSQFRGSAARVSASFDVESSEEESAENGESVRAGCMVPV